MTNPPLSPADLASPFITSVQQIEPGWIDYNGHLNMAYYNVIMDRALDEFFSVLGLGPDYLKTRNGSTMTAECHVRYLREVHLGDPVQVAVYFIDVDEKRIHTFEELRHATEGWVSATSENMTLHIDMSIRRVAPMPPDIKQRAATILQAHAGTQKPDGHGRRVEMPVRK